MAVRYSGSLKIHVAWSDRLSTYKVSVSRAGRSLWSGTVGAPRSLTRSVDSPVAYDETAHAALSFAADDGADVEDHADYTDKGFAVTRTPTRANPSRRRATAKRRTVKRRTAARRASKRATARRR